MNDCGAMSPSHGILIIEPTGLRAVSIRPCWPQEDIDTSTHRHIDTSTNVNLLSQCAVRSSPLGFQRAAVPLSRTPGIRQRTLHCLLPGPEYSLAGSPSQSTHAPPSLLLLDQLGVLFISAC
ncbi:hypothetical protein HBH82_037310 [Parastagonospora nodorum]|nr:hypothetical protein HBH49_045670 [Parastagonospora nodorum]KAH4611335.1 hypothetical protein HBH82_037310 [Parastagonospora nodorum]KAH4693575.1 hypothetical protein HBH78_073290 [Parastagonospora nodorum]KAH4700677.1 hypothetical protein HBH67_143990 [Parastagonospora nodorum]KAH4789679.1 hypothetical protein HBH62_044480 [Parastagonospora nodorum]